MLEPPDVDGQWGAFTSAQARACGWSSKALSRAVHSGDLIRPRRGVFAVPVISSDAHEQRRSTHLQHAAAAVLAVGEAALSHRTAAMALGLPVLGQPDEPCLTVPVNYTDIAGVHVHRGRLAERHRTDRDGLPRTTVVRTCLDVTRESGTRAGLVTTDAALRIGLVGLDELTEEYRQLRGGAGLRDGPRLLELASPLSESALESVSWFALQGLSELPDRQVTVLDELGRFVGRVDYCWRRSGLIGEADGRVKYTDSAVLRAEKERADRLAALGLRVVRWDWATALDGAGLVRLLQSELVRTDQLRSAGFPCTARLQLP